MIALASLQILALVDADALPYPSPGSVSPLHWISLPTSANPKVKRDKPRLNVERERKGTWEVKEEAP